jgi:hypothetical protein
MGLCTGRNKYRTPIENTGLLKGKLKAAHQTSALLGVFSNLINFSQLLFYYVSVMQSIV